MNKTQRDFCDFFEKNHNDCITDLILARVDNNSGIIQTDLELAPGRTELWGLLLIGEKALHFYDHATESSLMTLFRGSGKAPPQPQLLSIPYENIQNITCVTPKKNLWNFISPKETQLTVEYNDSSQIPVKLTILIGSENRKFVERLTNKNVSNT